MKYLLLISMMIILSNCSFNKDESFNKKLKKKIYNSNDIMALTFDEYKIFIVDYVRKSKYPNINE